MSPSRRAAARMPLVVLSAAAGLDAGSVAVLNGALPSLGAEFGVSPGTLSWAVTGYALAFAGLLLGGGALADRFPRRRVLTAGLTALACGALLALAAPAFWVVALGRVAQGAGAAVTIPAATALIADVHPPGRERSRALGVFASAQGAAYGAGLVLGGTLTSLAGWRLVFAAQAGCALLTAAGARAVLPAGRADRSRPLDPAGAAALISAIVLLVLGADLLARPGGAAPGAVALGLAAAGSVLAWRRSRAGSAARGRLPLLDPGLLRIRGVRAGALAAIAFYFCVTGAFFLLPLHLQRVGGMSPAASGFAVLPVSVAVAVTAWAAGRRLARGGPGPLLATGLPLTAGGVALWCLAGPQSPYVWPVLAGLLVTGAGQGLAFTALTAMGLRGVPVPAQGAASAVTVTALQIGSGVGPAVLATAAQAAGGGSGGAPGLSGYRLAYAIAAGVALLGLFAVRAGRDRAAAPAAVGGGEGGGRARTAPARPPGAGAVGH
ncbi:MFS transporter [Streptomyces hoynatensis]|nr:MFS transporter [Streptomyces hoynatensis]